MANFLRTLALPDEMERWSLTTLRDEVVKIGAKVGFGSNSEVSDDSRNVGSRKDSVAKL